MQQQYLQESNLSKIPVPDKFFFFKSCVGSNKYPGIETCTMDCLQKLGIEMHESEDQTCCGGFVTFANVAAPTASMPAVARNLSLAEEKNLDVCVVCNGCWTFLNEFRHFMNHNAKVKESVNMMMGMIGREYQGSSRVFHIAEILYRLKNHIPAQVERPLTGIKIATHYGCHYLGGGKYHAIDDAQYPTFLEDMIERVGGTNVYYTANRECCGTGFTQIINGKDFSLSHTETKLNSIQKEADPDLLVVMCPYCLSQLDRIQQQLNYRRSDDYQIPVIHVVQLIGLALGVPGNRLAFDAHISGRTRLQQVLDKLSIDCQLKGNQFS